MEKIKEFIEDYFEYTTTISITETEWLSNYEWLETWYSWRDTTAEDYHKEALKDLLYDLIYNQNAIKKQLETDIDNFGVDSEEFEYIKNFYNKWKGIFNFKIEKIESEAK